MTTTTKKKRIDKIEGQLTPKQWAISLADEMQKYPSQVAFFSSFGPVLEELPWMKPFPAFDKLAEEKYPGKNSEDIRAKNQLTEKLSREYQVLKLLILDTNEIIQNRIGRAGLEAALKLSTLQTIILQDAFARTASKAAEWIEQYKTEDQDDEEERQIMLKELAAYTEVSYAERASDSLPIGNIRIKFPTVIELWVRDAVLVISDIFRHKAAVQIVQDKYFDGHPILYRNVVDDLEKTIRVVEDAVATLNEYLKTRRELFETEWNQEALEEDGITSAIPGEREGRLAIDIDDIRDRVNKRSATTLANEWANNAKMKGRLGPVMSYEAGQEFLDHYFNKPTGGA